VIGAASRAVLSLRSGAGLESRYGASYAVDSVIVTVVFLLVLRQRCLKIQSEWNPRQVKSFVLMTLPAALFSCTTSMLFMIGEAMSCLMEKLNDEDEYWANPDGFGLAGCRDNENEGHFCALALANSGGNYSETCTFKENMCQVRDLKISPTRERSERKRRRSGHK
jgi:hypothetical protein